MRGPTRAGPAARAQARRRGGVPSPRIPWRAALGGSLVEQLTAVVLAAGRGTRMKSNLPKVLHPLCGRPMMMYALDAVRRSGVAHPLLVVGKDPAVFRAAAGSAPRVVVQRR